MKKIITTLVAFLLSFTITNAQYFSFDNLGSISNKEGWDLQSLL